jgi:hypothetical protein
MRNPVLALAACLFASLAQAQPAPAPAKYSNVPHCNCGCEQTGKCLCKNCCQRTADPFWEAVAQAPTPTPGPAPTPPASQTATITIVGCVGSIVSFDGTTLWEVGNTRTVTTPPISVDSHYQMTATSFERTITGPVTVSPGKVTTVILDWTNSTLTFSVAARKPAAAPAFNVGGCPGGQCGQSQGFFGRRH